jgi:hypothetical protein
MRQQRKIIGTQFCDCFNEGLSRLVILSGEQRTCGPNSRRDVVEELRDRGRIAAAKSGDPGPIAGILNSPAAVSALCPPAVRAPS